MAITNTQCVYEHWRPDLGQCFYVGRGPASRANNLHPRNRNKHHGRVVQKLHGLGLCVEVRIFAGGLSFTEANAIEITRIAHYRKLGHPLTNQTDGGEGLINPSAETREKMASRQRGRKMPIEIRMKMSEAAKRRAPRSPEHCANIAKAKTGRKRTPFHFSEATRQMLGERLRKMARDPAMRSRMVDTYRKNRAKKRAVIQPSLFGD